ncbi:MAG: hypothetical protein JNJ41_12265 [Bacteroidia bacterium]|nr:hypothetical protein [Bacteroidia bacterium]
MKRSKLIIIWIIMTTTINLSAQDPNYKGSAKMDVSTFWRQAEIVKSGKATSSTLSNLEKSFDNIKKKDPSYNTSSMEEIIITCKEKVNSDKKAEDSKKEKHLANMDAGRSETQNALKIKKMFDDVFDISSFSFKDLDKAQAENDAYKKEADDLLAMKGERDAYIAEMKKGNEYDRFVGKIKIGYDRNFDTFIEKVDKIMAQSTGGDDGNWKNVYYEMQAEQIRWDAAQKVFPDEPKFAEAYKKITARVNQYGSLEKIAGKNKENSAEKIKNQKLPNAAIKDAALEKLFVDAFNKKYSSEYKGAANKAIMLQTDWQTERNEISGVVTGRIRQGAIVYKGTDGKCYLVSIMHLYQEYIGGSFQNSKAVYAQYGQEMLCENAK